MASFHQNNNERLLSWWKNHKGQVFLVCQQKNEYCFLSQNVTKCHIFVYLQFDDIKVNKQKQTSIHTKGQLTQLISKCPFAVFKSPKKPTKLS